MQSEREKIIEDILERSVSSVLPSKEDLKKLLLSGKRLRVYIGADATGPDLHLGHSTNYILLEKFRKLGHEAIVLFGDFTAMIGDPTDKNATRVALSKKQVSQNIKSWKKQIAPIVSFGGRNKARVVKNSKWLSRLSFEDVVNLSSNFTVQQMLERDMFEKRLGENKPIHLHEFLYPLMQGFDSVALDVDIEIGGNDQTFNMLAGRTLQKKLKNREKFVVATTLLENKKTGKKLMSKSEGGYVGLMDKPQDMFGKIMALPDESIKQLFLDCTFVDLERIEGFIKDLENGINPRDIKIILAEEIVTIYHSKKQALIAKDNFIKTFSQKDVSEESFIVLKANTGDLLGDILCENGIIKSKSDFTRLIKEGGVSDITNDSKKIDDHRHEVFVGEKYKIGKHRFVKII